MKKTVLAIAVAMATLGTAQAQSTVTEKAQAPMHYLVGFGVTVGGDNLANVRYTNGDSQDIKAGGGGVLTTGIDYRVSPEFSVQGTLNFHFMTTNAKNGNVTFQRFPIEFLGYYHPAAQWRVGGGVRYVSGPKLSSSGAASGIDLTFKDTVSGVIEAEYMWSPRSGVKLRYVSEKFEAKGYNGKTNANHIGISGNFYF
jgi:opacity protein-like surface antigen